MMYTKPQTGTLQGTYFDYSDFLQLHAEEEEHASFLWDFAPQSWNITWLAKSLPEALVLQDS